MASFRILFLIILVNLISFLTCCDAQVNPVYLSQDCSGTNSTDGSVFQSNLKTLLSSFSSNARNANTLFYQNTIAGEDPANSSVYGLFMCRGDIPSQLCQQCVESAVQRLRSQCSLTKRALIWYDVCMLRYSNHSFFSTVDTEPKLGLYNMINASNKETFTRLLFSTMNQTADEAARDLHGQKKFATKEAITVSGFQTLYCLAQCTQDLSPRDCRICLNGTIGDLPWCCEGRQGGRVVYPSCNIRYEVYPFYLSTTPPSTPIFPASNFSDRDAKLATDPIYLRHSCSETDGSMVDAGFQNSLATLLSYLSSNATNGKKFQKEEFAYTVFGLFMCRGDVPDKLCGECVANASQRIASECRLGPEAIIWYSQCLLRYSYWDFISKVETRVEHHEC